MVIAGAWFFIGAVINAAAQDLAMLYLGRIFLGFGVGFANQSVGLNPNLHWSLTQHCLLSQLAQYCWILLHTEDLCIRASAGTKLPGGCKR